MNGQVLLTGRNEESFQSTHWKLLYWTMMDYSGKWEHSPLPSQFQPFNLNNVLMFIPSVWYDILATQFPEKIAPRQRSGADLLLGERAPIGDGGDICEMLIREREEVSPQATEDIQWKSKAGLNVPEECQGSLVMPSRAALSNMTALTTQGQWALGISSVQM